MLGNGYKVFTHIVTFFTVFLFYWKTNDLYGLPTTCFCSALLVIFSVKDQVVSWKNTELLLRFGLGCLILLCEVSLAIPLSLFLHWLIAYRNNVLFQTSLNELYKKVVLWEQKYFTCLDNKNELEKVVDEENEISKNLRLILAEKENYLDKKIDKIMQLENALHMRENENSTLNFDLEWMRSCLKDKLNRILELEITMDKRNEEFLSLNSKFSAMERAKTENEAKIAELEKVVIEESTKSKSLKLELECQKYLLEGKNTKIVQLEKVEIEDSAESKNLKLEVQHQNHLPEEKNTKFVQKCGGCDVFAFAFQAVKAQASQNISRLFGMVGSFFKRGANSFNTYVVHIIKKLMTKCIGY